MTPQRMNLILKLVLAALLLLTAAGLYLANSYLTKLAYETADMKARVEIDQKQLSTYEQTKATVDSLSYVDGLASEVLPASEDQSVVVAELSQFARRSNLTVAQITFDTTQTATTKAKTSKDKKTTPATVPPKGVNVTPITLQLNAGGNYTDLLDFLVRLEENRRTMQVTNLALAPNPDDRSKLDEVTISINLYTKPASEDTP